MNCEKFQSNVAAFLAGELDERSSDELRRHAEECSQCAAGLKSTGVLVDMLKAHPDRNVPEQAEARVLDSLKTLRGKSGQQTASPVPLLSRIQGAMTMKRSLIAAGLAAIVIVVGLGVLPSNKGNAVLAQVAHAMANVRSAHVIGYEIRPETGERRDFEMWIKHPAKWRAQVKLAHRLYEISDDGTRRVELDSTDKACSATISPSEGMPQDMPALSWFDLEGMLKTTKAGIVASRDATLPDGRRVQVIELAGMNPDRHKSVITIDKATDLLVQTEEWSDGKLVMKIERVDYNVEVPDSKLEIAIPKNALVDDQLHPASESPERQAKREEITKQMDADGAHLIANLGPGDSCGAPCHSGMRFTITSPATHIWYAKSRNAYYVFGKAVVTDSKKRGYRRVVEDGWLNAPYRPDRRPGIFQMRINKPGDYRKFILPDDAGNNGIGAERIQNTGNGPLILMDEDCGIRFYGEAKVYPQGTVYHDGQIVPLPDIRVYGEGDEYDFAKADFGNLPDSEIKAMKAEMGKHNRVWRQYHRNEEVAGKRLPDDAIRQSSWGPGSRGQDRYFKVDSDVGMTLYYIPSRDSVYVAGRAKMVTRHFFRRVETTVENEEVEAPGPEYRESYEERQKEQKQWDEYNKQKPNIRFDEWLKQHPELQ